MERLQYPFDGADILQNKRAIKKELAARANLTEKRIAILSGSTVGEVKNILELFLLGLGIRPTFFEGGYGLFYEELVYDSTALASFAPDVIYIHTSNRNIRSWPQPGDDEDAAAQTLRAEFDRFAAAWAAALALGCSVVQNNFEEPAYRNFGNADAFLPGGRVQYVRSLNKLMADFSIKNPSFYIHDLAWLASMNGVDRWCSQSAWYAYKYCCAVEYIPALCHSLASLIGSFFGRGKKCVVTDLDNTLWGGVIGEVGPEGVEIGDETPAGMAFADYAAYLKLLSTRGVMLAVASKNEETAAASGFTRPEMPLSRDDFLAFEANWEPKSLSIARIAERLNILPDSIVFTDDNPAERDQVRSALPAVAAPPFGAPEDSIRLLDRSGWFEASSVTADDMARAEMYRQNARREDAENNAASYGEYLLGLGMTADIGAFRPDQLERVTQLINKTNQFNLTTRRYSAAEVAAAAVDVGHITLAGRLADRFGDNGITSAIIATRDCDTLDIDLWVMSCRVFKRHFEFAMFDALVAAAKAEGICTIRGAWLRTAKNLLVENFYATIGFEQISGDADEKLFSFAIPSDYQPLNHEIKVETE